MNYFSELKRRNVFKVAIAYLALGWVVVQITDIVVPALNLPETLNSIVVYIGIIGFPFALFFAWAFELTPEGVKKTAEVDVEESIRASTGQKINYIIIGLLVVAVMFLVYDRGSVPQAELRANTIAVMPFADMSADGSQEYFGDGIAEEILNVLVKFDELDVTSRTSSFAYKGTNTQIPAIAAELNVNYIVEGSIRSDGNQVRVTAQLIDVANDTHLWSDTYDRELTSIFAIQDEISQAITGALRIELIGGESLVEAPTTNMEAYALYLKGRQLFLNRGTDMNKLRADGLGEAEAYYQQALKLDQTFAESWADLAAITMLTPEYNLSLDTSDIDHIPIAKAAADRAISLKPDLSQAWAIKGLINLGEYKFLDARTALLHALKLNPSNESALLWLGEVYAAVGNQQQAINVIDRAIELSPNTGINYIFLMRSLQAIGDEERLKSLLDIETFRSNPIGNIFIDGLAILEQENIDQSNEILFRLFSYFMPEMDEEQTSKVMSAFDIIIAAYFDPTKREQAATVFTEYIPSRIPLLPFITLNGELIINTQENSRLNKGAGLSTFYVPQFRSLFNLKIIRDYFIEIGMFDYWKNYGFPDFCRPQGDDDFVCDDGKGGFE